MSEIKFRAYHPNIGYVLADDLTFTITRGKLSYVDGNFSITDNGGQDWILEQFTGLKDKNGVEIYEGDIVRFIDSYSNRKYKEICEWEVEFINGEFFPRPSACSCNEYDNMEAYDFEVIGNIREEAKNV